MNAVLFVNATIYFSENLVCVCVRVRVIAHVPVCHSTRARKKNVLVLVIGRVDFDANKKNAGRKITQDTVFTCETSRINRVPDLYKNM